MDGSQKLPQRLLGTIRDRLAADLPIDRAALGVAAWMRYVTGIDENGRAIDVRDPLGVRLGAICASAGGDPKQITNGLLRLTEVFGDDLSQSDAFRGLLVRHLASLLQKGALETARQVNLPR
jgi:fructuronate reductase